jgi:DNA-binding transcriptional LysR family regulator
VKITLKQLRVFDAIARSGGVARAANDISLTQSAASMSLKALEGQLDAQLFDRQGKRLQLNDYGRWLQPKAHSILQQINEIEHSAQNEELQGQLQIGASSTIANYLLPKIMAEFVSEHSQVSIDLKVGNTGQVIDDLLHLRIDLGLIEGLCDEQYLDLIPWRRDKLVVFCSPEHPLAKKKKISARELSTKQWILRESGSGTREIFTLASHGVLEALPVKLELGNSEAIKQAVKTGLGLGCLSELTLKSELAHGELKLLSTPYLKLERQLYILNRNDLYRSQLLQSFIRALKNEESTH